MFGGILNTTLIGSLLKKIKMLKYTDMLLN